MTAAMVRTVVTLINNWSGTLTWDDLCAAVGNKTGLFYTRQTLSKYEQIKSAFRAYKAAPEPCSKRSTNSENQADKKVRDLERKVNELQALVDTLLEKFARWAVNASTKNLTEEFLDRPLRQINRAKNR
ncbi:hypothetical protein F3Y33_20800 (plasmid) [Rhizobium sp. BG6]|uniref:hypothetical protein n=1 Tax=Rhizobium sp. BG6 TaxID=2613771 RepID=UPI00193EAC79|nr:hypothetical protein [Rhizobium sp. BG6]QRM51755.1 hypothetical protein F3Y33_20800 [Rhizobium sp. BG6]